MNMTAMIFNHDFEPQYGAMVQVDENIRRVVANNPGAFTGAGTATYIIGNKQVAKNTSRKPSSIAWAKVQQVYAAIAKGINTPAKIRQNVYPQISRALYRGAELSIMAALEFLVANAQAQITTTHNRPQFALVSPGWYNLAGITVR